MQFQLKQHLATLVLVAAAASPALALPCGQAFSEYIIAEGFKKALGIGDGFDTRLRVEKKSTNYQPSAEAFRDMIGGSLNTALGESFTMRDKPSSPDRVLVTATNYPFSRDVQNLLNARIRIREYGERRFGTKTRFTSTMGDSVNLEVKAKTALPGVVVKPILKIPKNMLPLLQGGIDVFMRSREQILQTLNRANPDSSDTVQMVLNVVGDFHLVSQAKNLGMENTTVEYQRQAYVLEVFDKQTVKTHKVQMTFDRMINMREGTDPTMSPWDATATPPTHSYPDAGPTAVVVTEMKSDLWLDQKYRRDPVYVQANVASYWKIRQQYERMQEAQAEGFEADSGKAAQLTAFRND